MISLRLTLITFLTALLIGMLSVVSLRFYFQTGVPYTHDGENHLARFANYKIALKEGQFPPRFAPNLANRYGYPVFNYNYPLANILSVPFSLIKVPYTLTFKILMGVGVVGGLVGVWCWLRTRGIPVAASWMGMAVFATHPYLMSTILFRGNVGEVIALGLLPWLLWSVEKIKRAQWYVNTIAWLLLPVLWATFFLSHNVTVLIGAPIVLVYAALVLRKQWPAWISLLSSLGLGVGLSLWFWLPALVEKSAVVLDKADLSVHYYDHFVTLHQLLFSALSFGYDFVGSIDSLSFQLGILSLGVILLAAALGVRLLYKRWRQLSLPTAHTSLGVTTLGVVVLCGLQLAVSTPIWQAIPILRFAQFPWRFMLLVAVFLPLLAATVYELLNPFWRRCLWLMVLVQVVILAHLHPVDIIKKTNAEYDNFSQTTSTLNENLPVGFTYGLNGEWQPSPLFLSGEGNVEVIRWNGSERQYRVIVTQLATLVEPTMYFLGWETRVQPEGESKAFVIPYQTTPEVAGRVGYQLPRGEYLVSSRFTQHTWARQWSHIITLLTGVGLGIWGLKLSWGILSSRRNTDIYTKEE